MKRLFALVLVIIMCLSLLAACSGSGTTTGDSTETTNAAGNTGGGSQNTGGGSQSTGGGSQGGSNVPLPDKKIRIGLAVQAGTGDPLTGPLSATGDRSVSENVFESLITHDTFGNIYPWLAKTYEYNEDQTEWIFHLQEGVTFSNGEPMNADDVVCSFDRFLLKYTDARMGSYLQGILPGDNLQGAEKIDDYTVKVTLARPYAGTLLAFTDIMIIPDETYAQYGDALFESQIEGYYIGTGPWIITEHIIGQSAHFRKNPNYWNKNYDSYYDEVEYLFITEQTTAIAAMLSGDMQVYVPNGGIRPDLLSQLEPGRDKYDLYITEQKPYFYMQLNCEEGKPFNELAVRQAFLMSIDYESITTYILGGGTVMNQFVPVGYEGYDPDLPPYDYDPDEARRILEASGYDGSEVHFIISFTTLMAEDQILTICEGAQKIGLNITPEIYDNSTMGSMREAGEYDVFIAVGALNDADPLVYLTKRIRDDVHKHNLKDDILMNAITDGSNETNKEKREAYYRTAMRRMRELWGPDLGLYYIDQWAAVGYGINGLKLDAGGYQMFTFIDYDVNDPMSTNHRPKWDVLTNF